MHSMRWGRVRSHITALRERQRTLRERAGRGRCSPCFGARETERATREHRARQGEDVGADDRAHRGRDQDRVDRRGAAPRRRLRRRGGLSLLPVPSTTKTSTSKPSWPRWRPGCGAWGRSTPLPPRSTGRSPKRSSCSRPSSPTWRKRDGSCARSSPRSTTRWRCSSARPSTTSPGCTRRTSSWSSRVGGDGSC